MSESARLNGFTCVLSCLTAGEPILAHVHILAMIQLCFRQVQGMNVCRGVQIHPDQPSSWQGNAWHQ